MVARLIAAFVAAGAAAAVPLGGCNLVSAVAQNAEYEKQIEVLAQYDGLENKTVAILVDVDPATLYEHPSVAGTIAVGVWNMLRTNVPSARFLPQTAVLDWQYRTPQWSGMPYGELAKELNVDRLIVIDLYEYRLHPPGNSWEWEGLAAANIGIVERDGLDPDTFAATFDSSAKYPDQPGYGKESLRQNLVETVLINKFINKTAWLFYKHIEQKYPDKALHTK
jgi:hypothetical protein